MVVVNTRHCKEEDRQGVHLLSSQPYNVVEKRLKHYRVIPRLHYRPYRQGLLRITLYQIDFIVS